MRPKRQGLIVWYKHRRNLRQIRRYGHLIYASKRLKYAMIYVDQEEIDQIEKKMNKYKFIKKTERSHLPSIHSQYHEKKSEETRNSLYTFGI